VQARASIGHQQPILADLQDDAGAGDRVADPKEHVLGDVGDGHLHRHGHGIDQRSGQRDHEEHEKERKPLRLERGGATGQQEDRGEQPDDRADFEQEDVLRAANGVKQQAEDEDRPTGGGGAPAFARLPHVRPFAPGQPAGDGKNDRTVLLFVAAPDTGEQIDQAGHIENRQAGNDRQPGEQGLRGAGRGGGYLDGGHRGRAGVRAARCRVASGSLALTSSELVGNSAIIRRHASACPAGLSIVIGEVMVILSFRRELQRHSRIVAVLLVLSILFGLFVLGAQPFAVGLVPVPWDKLAHGVVFAVLAALLGQASGLRGWRMMLVAIAGALLVGGLDEWHQVYLPGRQAGLDDLTADGIGGMIGAMVLSARTRKND